MSSDSALLEVRAGKYLNFQLSGEIYGLEILTVQEIIGMMSVTHVPRLPAFIRGVINLRGKVIPVLDLRLRFLLEAQGDTERTCIIVTQIVRDGATLTMGLIVDEVAEVLNIGEEQIEPPPSLGEDVTTDYLLGMGRVEQKVVMLLNLEKVLTLGEETPKPQDEAAA